MARPFTLGVFALLLCAPVAAADHHLNDERSRPLVQRSAFAHGYLHGYEEGFSSADRDIQLGRMLHSSAVRSDKFNDKESGYRRQYGDRQQFSQGFEQGRKVGYADGAAGLSFRAIQEARRAAKGLASGPPDQVFDKNFEQGYFAGRERGLRDGRRDAPSRPGAACPRPQSCEGYLRGFQLGYADGWVNQTRRDVLQLAGSPDHDARPQPGGGDAATASARAPHD